MIKHFLIPSALIVLAAMSSCSPNDDKLNKTYTDQLAPGTLTNATIKWTSSAPGDSGPAGKILLMSLGTTEVMAFNIGFRQFLGNNTYKYSATGTSGFLSIDVGQLFYTAPNIAYYYGEDFKGFHYGTQSDLAKSFFSRSFFGGQNNPEETPFRINFISFNGFQGYKAEIYVPRGSVWAGQFQEIDQPTATIPVDITFSF